MQSTDEKYMKEAIKQAKKAYAIGEVPIGCVIVYQDKIIGRGYNRRTIDNNTLAHAELIAIKKASKKTGGLYDVCNSGTMPDVFRCDRTVPDDTGSSRMYESESRLCRLYLKSSGYA